MMVSVKRWLRAGVVLGVLGALMASPAMAQPPGGGGRGGFGGGNFGGFGGGSNLLGLLANDDVKKELQLLDDQVADIERLTREQGEEMRGLFQPGGDRDAMMAKINEVRKKTEEQLAKVLEPDQLKRLKQIDFQQAVNRGMGGFASGIISDQVAAELGLTKDQIDALSAAQKQADEEFRKKQAQIRQEVLDSLVAKLTPEQQAKFKDLYGKPFEMRFTFGNPGGGRGPGGPGGPGGQGGRGQGNQGGRGGNRQRPNSDRDL